jgi:hypothetical protein
MNYRLRIAGTLLRGPRQKNMTYYSFTIAKRSHHRDRLSFDDVDLCLGLGCPARRNMRQQARKILRTVAEHLTCSLMLLGFLRCILVLSSALMLRVDLSRR